MFVGDGNYRWYPRVIRAHDDLWSKSAIKAHYSSDIAALLHEYSNRARNTCTSDFRPEANTILRRRFDRYRELLRKISLDASDVDYEFPSIEELTSSERLCVALFKQHIPDEFTSVLLKSSSAQIQKIFRLLTFARFSLHRVAITVVTSHSEDDAFDMFESLNTTGIPLTAFETFRPRVIKQEGFARYRRSESAELMGKVESYLQSHTLAQQRTVTNDFVTSFALAETGKKLSHQLSEQRRYLRDNYQKADTKVAKVEFVRHLSDTVRFIRDAWNPKTQSSSGPSLPRIGDLSSQSKMCLYVLQQSKHKIVISPLTEVFSRIINRTLPNQTTSYQKMGHSL